MAKGVEESLGLIQSEDFKTVIHVLESSCERDKSYTRNYSELKRCIS